MLYTLTSSIIVYLGLHLCYLQSHSTIDSMSVVVSNTSPSILPYIKVRENPHVNAEEWAWIKSMGSGVPRVPVIRDPDTQVRMGRDED